MTSKDFYQFSNFNISLLLNILINDTEDVYIKIMTVTYNVFTIFQRFSNFGANEEHIQFNKITINIQIIFAILIEQLNLRNCF